MNSSTLWSGLRTWSQERFPFVSVVSGLLLYAVAASLIRDEIFGSANWSGWDLLFGFAVVAHLLLLRVLDEHKDFEGDSEAFPDRALQRGLVSLNQLKVVGGIALTLTLLGTLAAGSASALWMWGVLIFWTVMMFFEMFCKEWLRKHLFVYSVSHIFVVALIITWASTMAQPAAPQTEVLPWIASLAFLNGLIFEVLRKIKGRDEEIQSVETFSSLWGIRKSVVTGIVLHVLSFGVVIAFATSQLQSSVVALIPSALAFVISIASLLQFQKDPISKNRKKNEGAGALYSLVVYITFIVLAHRK